RRTPMPRCATFASSRPTRTTNRHLAPREPVSASGRRKLKDVMSRAAGRKKAKSRLGQVKRALIQYVHRLGANSARRKLDPTLRQTFMAAGVALTPDVTTLRKQLVCPVADAA